VEEDLISLHRFDRTKGFTLLETLAVLAIAAILFAGFTTLVSTASGNARAQQAALYQSQVSTAAAQLIKDNYSTLITAAMSATTPLKIWLTASTPTGYKLGAYLPSSIQAFNAYQQKPCLLVYHGAGAGWTGGTGLKDIVAFLVTEGGQTIDDRTLGNIVANAGAGAGAIQAKDNGVANGAFGSWSAPLTTINPTNTNCNGTATGAGHLVSQIYYTGSSGASGDFLYRQPVSVTGVTDGNTMHAPIVLSDVRSDRQSDADCDSTLDATGTRYVDLGKVTSDNLGNVLTCSNTVNGVMWTELGSMHWGGAVSTYNDLMDPNALGIPLSSLQIGDVRLVSTLGRAFAWTGSQWQALAVDEKGNLSVPGLLTLAQQGVIGTSCPNTPASDVSANQTAVTTDAAGRVLSCRNGVWRAQSEVVPGTSSTGCQILMASPGAADYPTCSGPPSNNYTAPPFALDGTGTYTYTRTFNRTLDNPGMISVSTWAHMNDGVCQADGSEGNYRAQLAQQVYVYDSSRVQKGQAAAQSPTLVADSGGINNSVLVAVPAGDYQVEVHTQWAMYLGPGTPWTSSYCYPWGTANAVPNSPIVWGWTVNTYY
jgi:prepilin-type N-terminal cleavage/methylation domain-containing protein